MYVTKMAYRKGMRMSDTEGEEKKNLIYDLMNGSLVLDEVKDLWKDQVVDEFAKGSYCSELYEEVYQAKVSLCNRLEYRKTVILRQLFPICC